MSQWLPLILIVVGVIIMVAVGYALRRRRAAAEEVPEIGVPTDYTSLPIEEPTGWRDRFSHLSLAGKILLVVVPLLLIVGAVVIVLALNDNLNQTASEPLPAPIVYTLNVSSASLVNARSIVIRANTNLPQDTPVEATLLANNEPFAWSTPDSARSAVNSSGQIEIRMVKAASPPAASDTMSYTVQLVSRSGGVGGVGAREYTAISPLTIPPTYAGDFFSRAAEPAPTAAQVAAAPTATAEPAATTAPAVTETPAGSAALTASVFNGGNVRSIPQIQGSQVLDQINAGEQVQLLQKTANGQWYQINNIRGKLGWVSVTLLTIDQVVGAQVPTQGQATPLPTAATSGQAPVATSAPAATSVPNATASITGLAANVFNGGNVRSIAQIQGSQVLDQINAGEQVQLLQKTANGQWYQIKNIRGKVGWVNVSLLTIDPTVAAKVPVAP